MPSLFAGLVDDAAVFPPGSAPVPAAVVAHRQHREAWYSPLVGPLLVPVDDIDELRPLLDPGERLGVGIIGDVPRVASVLPVDFLDVRQVEAPVAKRGEDPLPGLSNLLAIATAFPTLDLYAEVPLTWGLLSALDAMAEARAGGVRVAAKFRTGGLAAELFPTPVELAAVICACRDRGLPFKLTAGLHRAIRHNDPETGFTHHGFLNILAAAMAADDGAEVVTVAERLGATDPVPLIEAVRPRRSAKRPLWTGFGSCSVLEPLGDLRALGLLGAEVSA